MDEQRDRGHPELAAAHGHDIVACNGCPVRCRIRYGRTGACGRYANHMGGLGHLDPAVVTARAAEDGAALVPFAKRDPGRETLLRPAPTHHRGGDPHSIYPDYKPAPFVVARRHAEVDTVTVVSEGMFTDCSVKVKIDVDRKLGAERSRVRAGDTVVGHVTTAEHGTQMLALGGTERLAPADAEARSVMAVLGRLCSREAVELDIEDGARVVVRAGAAPVVDGTVETSTRVGCGSATVGLFARAWDGHVDEVIVVDERITGVLSEHQAGQALGMTPSGLRVRGRPSTPGRYFQAVAAGPGWAGTDLEDPRAIIHEVDASRARPGLRVLITTATGTASFYGVLDAARRLQPAPMPPAVARVLDRIVENCEPACCSVLLMAGAGRSLRAGVTEQPVLLSRAVRAGEARMTMAGQPVYVWPGAGLTVMVDVAAMPRGAFATLPRPALVAPVEFTLPRHLYAALGGHDAFVQPLEAVVARQAARSKIHDVLGDGAGPLARAHRGS